MNKNRALALILCGLLAASSFAALTSAQEIPGIVADNDADYSVMPIEDTDDFESGDVITEKVVYVSADGSADNDGLTVENALPTLQDGLNALGLDGGTLFIVGEVSLGDKAVAWPGTKADGQKRITITGYDDE